MYWNEHQPPHFHVEYGGSTAIVDIESAVVLRGVLPSKQLKLVLAWCELHRDELKKNWNLASQHAELQPVEPIR